MRSSNYSRAGLNEQIRGLASQMVAWETEQTPDDGQQDQIRDSIVSFNHATAAHQLVIGGVDGSGDFPSLTYSDSFIYVATATGTLYQSSPISGLTELEGPSANLVEFVWLPEDTVQRMTALDRSFERIVGRNLRDVIERSDYRKYKSKLTRRQHDVDKLIAELIRPHASDAGNLGIQLRTLAELSMALKLINGPTKPDIVLYDSTLSLPMVTRHSISLFQEHVKRLCCVEADERDIGFFALSKSHGLRGTETFERLAAESQGLGTSATAEHWLLRIPSMGEPWVLAASEGRNLPPPGAVTYLFRLHRNVPIMRLDIDEVYWARKVRGADEEETKANERRIFESLDYASHDQRCYGYPYPIKAGHDRASLTEAERTAFRRMIIDAAVAAGMRRSIFKNASSATGHV